MSNLNTIDYEENDLSPENREPSSPRSQELRDFEVYNRTNLPLLVEASLRVIVETQITPIEEHVRTMVVDIVRSCQSTVARNFHLTVSPTSSASDRMQPSFQSITPAENGGDTRVGSAPLSRHDTADNPLDSFCEPPHLSAEASASSPGPKSRATGSQDPNSATGYSSLPHSCGCSCHDYSNYLNTVDSKRISLCALKSSATKPNIGHSSCQSCAFMHLDFDILLGLDLDNSNNDFDWNDEENKPGALGGMTQSI